MMKKKNIFIVIAAVGVLIAGGLYFFVFRGEKAPGNTADTTGEVADIGPIPDLDRPIMIPEDMAPETAALAREHIASLSRDLKENGDLADYWIELGAYRKLIKDYDGAKEIWEYVTRLRPKDSRSYNNLADLYIYYLHDNKTAEPYLLKAIEIDPSDLQLYAAAFEFYFYVLKDPVKARAIVEKGVKANPGTGDSLKALLNEL